MAKYSGAKWRPLAGGHQPLMARHDIVCLHTMVGYLTSTDDMFKRNGWSGTESHFGVGGKWGGDVAKGYDGEIFQWVDTAHRADANLDGNHHIISIETADNAPKFVKDIKDWTPKQLDAIVKIVTWACRTYDIPPVLIPDSKPGRRGIGYHRQGCEHSLGVGKVPGFLVKGGERWSSSEGKECPGPRRIAQLKAIVIPRVKANLNPKPKPPNNPDPKPTPATPGGSVAKIEYDLELTTQYQVDVMNLNGPKTPYKIGDVIDLRRIFMWGGPAQELNLHYVRRLVNDLDDQATYRETSAAALQRVEDALTEVRAMLAPPTETEPGGTPGETRTV